MAIQRFRRRSAISWTALLGLFVLVAPMSTAAHDPKAKPAHTEKDAVHVHAAVPPEYSRHVAPASLWTDVAVLARGRAIYDAQCAVCHGPRGEGDGPAAMGLA